MNDEIGGVFKNIRVYWLAFVVYWGMVLFGYCSTITGSIVSAPYFLQYFGLINAHGSKNTAKVNAVSSNVVSLFQAGAFFGAVASAPLSARFGRKYTIIVFNIIFCIGAILTTVTNGPGGLAEIYAGRVISGFGVGAISAVSPAYVSECSPKEVRGRITSLFQVANAAGVVVAYFVGFGVGINFPTSVDIWRISFGLQLVPTGIMLFGLLTIKESPRWLASVGRHEEAVENLAYFRRKNTDSPTLLDEMVEIEAAIMEEKEIRQRLGIKQAFFGKGNWIRFIIAFFLAFFQQWAGQSSINHYSPQIFASIGFTGRKSSLLASGVYGIIKFVAAVLFVLFGVEILGRKLSLFISAIGMGTVLYIAGAILKTHPPLSNAASPSPASKAMAAMLYLYVGFFSMGCGPLPLIYASEIFSTGTRHYGLAFTGAFQWFWNFILSKLTPNLYTSLGYKMFLLFATVEIGGLAVFALIIPETKGRSLEEMDIIFGSISAEKRHADIDKRQRELNRVPSTVKF